MAMDVIETFVTASTVERLKMIKDSGQSLALKDYFGEAVFDEYARLAERLDLQRLSVSHPTNLLFVPGVMGSLLLSRTKGGIWWIDLRNLQHIDDLRLAPVVRATLIRTIRSRPARLIYRMSLS